MSDRRHTACLVSAAALASALAAALATIPARAAEPSPAPALLSVSPLAPPSMAAVRYVPEPAQKSGDGAPSSASSIFGVTQIHGGWFEPESGADSRVDVGLRAGPMLTGNLQVGLSVDWMYDSRNLQSTSTQVTGPGGIPIDVENVESRAAIHMIPMMAFGQLTGPEGMWVIPYVGGALGYQLAVVTAQNYSTGETFDLTVGGWGYQAWGGVALPLTKHMRLSGEAYRNGAEVARMISDPSSGLPVRQTAKTDGIGYRFGLSWGYH